MSTISSLNISSWSPPWFLGKYFYVFSYFLRFEPFKSFNTPLANNRFAGKRRNICKNRTFNPGNYLEKFLQNICYNISVTSFVIAALWFCNKVFNLFCSDSQTPHSTFSNCFIQQRHGKVNQPFAKIITFITRTRPDVGIRARNCHFNRNHSD